MTKTAIFTLSIAALGLAACGAPEQRVAVPRAKVAAQQPIAYRSVALREVSLPSYANSEEVFVADETGMLNSRSGVLWADDPTRAITLEIARYLAEISGAQVASEPWPFQDYPQATVEVRIEEMVARSTGVFNLAGQYFVAPESGRDRARLFDLSVPLPPDAEPGDMADARGQAVRALALEIARNGLR
ncbi:hypothetical protein D6850_10685 [Roseovarius spongiae]|uniref:ABC-type transport auxiliary lipoprotein component domain-containing protein n=1 Tax=Roseovarius spongiae TaxID=2320272 RepID=A0A3A8B5S0_9RHOB|nr:ABC-type transport auxiliary lipoprotein family protein [Roseovarius spongiae]RKF15286.1 hypothetical protein D6850_10685 [Roseovarius spongiae]